MSPEVRLGLIGAGVWGINYIKTIEQIEGVILEKKLYYLRKQNFTISHL